MNMRNADFYPKRRLLLLEDPTLQGYPAFVLRNLLEQSREVICRLFSDRIEELGKADTIKEFSACLKRADELENHYQVAAYYKTMFLFQQWFHSSYRARQGKVLESLMRYFLSKYVGFRCFAATEKEIKISREGLSEPSNVALVTVQEMIRKIYGKQAKDSKKNRLDIDIFSVMDHPSPWQCALALQIRSRDDTGGTTAKGSLVDFLKKLCDLGSPAMPTLYLICIWDAGDENQKETTISKIIDAMKPYVQESRQNDMRRCLREGKRFRITKRLYLQMRYGLSDIQVAIERWVRNSAPVRIQDLADELANWDDFWLAYAVASIEIYNAKLIGRTNLHKLGSLLTSLEYDRLNTDNIDDVLKKIIAAWDEECPPFTKPRDIALYIRDLLYLYAVYHKHCNGFSPNKSLFDLPKAEDIYEKR